MSEPAFRVRLRSVTNKHNGNVVRLVDFARKRPLSLDKFMKSVRATIDLNPSGVAAYFICAFDHEMVPTSATFIDDHIPVSNAILVAAVTEAFRHKLVDAAIDAAIEETTT